MTKRIFRSICLAAIAVFVITFGMTMGAVSNYFIQLQKQQLRSEISMAARGAELSGAKYFEQLGTKDLRVTWINAEGDVLYDSKSDSAGMENHLEREEIQLALQNGYGESSRYSHTLMERSLYAAQKLSDGTILRVSTEYSSVLQLMLRMVRWLLLIIFIAVSLSFVLAKSLSQRIVRPLNQLNLDHPLDNDGYDEITPILTRIDTQYKQLELQRIDLLRKQNELDTIIGSMQEGMILLNQECCILSINRSAEEILGTETNCVGKHILQVIGKKELRRAVQSALHGEEDCVHAELQGRVFQISAAPVFSDKKLSGVAIVFFDITDREIAEQQRREFTANVSHELKTPLQSISGYSELLKCGIVSAEDVRPFGEKIYNEAHRLIQLVEDIIHLSHLDEGSDEMPYLELDMYQMSQDVITQLEPVAAEKQVTLQLQGEHAQMLGVQELLHGVVYNLCDNAIKYNKTGGSVTISVTQNLTQVMLSVKDTGIGIPQEHIHRIFERFYRVDKSRSKAVGGTGLGLSIVKHSVKMHQGVISVSSEKGEGTEIRITFPKKPQ